MFIGHFAPAFAAAALGPRAPKLGTAFVAAQLVDWAFFSFAIIGVEKMRIDPDVTVMVPFDLYHMPYTHSLAACVAWAVAFTLIVFWWKRNALGAALVGVVVLSHWVLDWLTHRPDLSLMGGEARYGLGLWNYPAIAIPLELGITLAAFYFYIKRTRGPAGPPLILIASMLLFQAMNWFAPHPDVVTIGLYVQALVAFGVLTMIAWWVGENRNFVRRGGLAVPGG